MFPFIFVSLYQKTLQKVKAQMLFHHEKRGERERDGKETSGSPLFPFSNSFDFRTTKILHI